MTKGAKASWGAFPKVVLDALLPRAQSTPTSKAGTKRRHSTTSIAGNAAPSKKSRSSKELDQCDQCSHPMNTAHDNITSRRGLGKVNTEPNQWRRGMIIKVPHLIPTLGEAVNDDHRVWSKNIGNICPKIRYAIVVAVYSTRMIALPIFSAGGHGTTHKPAAYKLTAMSVLAKLEPPIMQKVTDDVLYVSGQWQPKEGSHINLNEPMPVHYAWPLECVDQLEPRSTALLQQRYRIAHNMAFVPLFAQESYFKSQITREPILCPLPDGAPADEYYVSEPHRPSFASKNENLLVDDLGYGLKPARHDSKAGRNLLQWKPSLKHLLGSTSEFPHHDFNDVWEVPSKEARNPGFQIDHYPYDHIKNKKRGAKWMSSSSEQISPRTIKLSNGRWQCLHDCADKKKCGHTCCKEGVKTKPKDPALERAVSLAKSGNRVAKKPAAKKPAAKNTTPKGAVQSAKAENEAAKQTMKAYTEAKRASRKGAIDEGTNGGQRKSERLSKAKAGKASK